MEDKKRTSEDKDEIYDQFYDITSVASATGLTGLTPALPLDDDEVESYSKIQGMPKPDVVADLVKQENINDKTKSDDISLK